VANETPFEHEAAEEAAHPSPQTVEAVVRQQMAQSLGGKRGILEAAIPSLAFTILWLSTKNLTAALVAAGAIAVVALVVRLVQRSSTQFVFNAIIGIAIGWIFVRLAASGGGDETQQALAFFLPSLIWSGVYSVVMAASCLSGWPFIGFMVGSVTGDPTAWHGDKQVVRLCSRLTWVFMAPGAIGVLLQGPVYVLGHTGVIAGSTAVAVIGVLRLGLGWVLRIASWSTMFWLLARNATPIDPDSHLAQSAD
jgi:hypothetical protein